MVAESSAKGEWRPVAAAALTCFFAGGLYGWSALIRPLQADFGISTGDAGLAFSLAIVSFTCAVLVTPKIFRQSASPQQIAMLAVLGAGFLAMAMVSASFWSFLFWFSGGFGAACGAIYIVGVSIAAGTHLPSVATPIVVAGFGAGGAVFGPLWRVLGNYGWGFKGLLFLVAGLILSAVFSACLKTPKNRIRTEAAQGFEADKAATRQVVCLLYTSPSPRDS